MPGKELYIRKEMFAEDIDILINEIRKTGARERLPDLSGARPALLVTDMQEYFLNPSSHAFIPSAEAIIPNIHRLIHHFEKNSYPVIFTKHVNTDEDASNMKTWWHDLITPNSPLVPLSPCLHVPQSPCLHVPRSPGPLVLQKNQYDAFHNTPLDRLLREKEIDTLVICGVMTNLCCETTLRSAFVKGYRTLFPVDATAAYRRDYHISTFINLCFGFTPLITTLGLLNTIGK